MIIICNSDFVQFKIVLFPLYTRRAVFHISGQIHNPPPAPAPAPSAAAAPEACDLLLRRRPPPTTRVNASVETVLWKRKKKTAVGIWLQQP